METTQTIKKPILDVEGLDVKFYLRDGTLNAVRDISFALFPGESLGVVGESGCGKSTTARGVLQLYRPTEGMGSARGICPNG
ncbi:MAG: ATP-binding cassette domain-containing protein [Deltaproteobacteria bacterium]|nr:ATP-binding cassette domain-containing protein [Deltaproteobacteria bacterium]